MEQQTRTITRAPREEGGLLWFQGTSEAVDSHDSIIRADGADFTRFRDNPVVLLDHENRVDSIAGQAEEIRPTDNPKGHEFGIRFASEESERAARAERLARAGILRGSSIGFIPKRVRQASEISEAERTLLGLGRFGYIVEEWELLELTVVPVGSNPEALKRAVAEGVLRMDDLEGFRTRPHHMRISGKRQEPAADDGMREAMLDMIESLRGLGEANEENAANLLAEVSNLGAAMAGAMTRFEAKLDLVAGIGAEVQAEAEHKAAADMHALRDRIEAAFRGGGGSTAGLEHHTARENR